MASSIFILWKLSLDNFGFSIMGHPLWREDESVIYSYCEDGPAQSQFRGTHDHISSYQIWGYLNVEGPGSRVCTVTLTGIRFGTLVTESALHAPHRKQNFQQFLYRCARTLPTNDSGNVVYLWSCYISLDVFFRLWLTPADEELRFGTRMVPQI
jgi:hypothetical protein